jgi:hypothetical protein
MPVCLCPDPHAALRPMCDVGAVSGYLPITTESLRRTNHATGCRCMSNDINMFLGPGPAISPLG